MIKENQFIHMEFKAGYYLLNEHKLQHCYTREVMPTKALEKSNDTYKNRRHELTVNGQ